MTLPSLIERLLGKRKAEELSWRCQYQDYFTPKSGNTDVSHFARHRAGFFEIYETDGAFLLLFPRSMGLPAEVLKSLPEAKAVATLKALEARNG